MSTSTAAHEEFEKWCGGTYGSLTAQMLNVLYFHGKGELSDAEAVERFKALRKVELKDDGN